MRRNRDALLWPSDMRRNRDVLLSSSDLRRNRGALLVALGVDNLGSGSFLPVALLYVTRVVGLPLAVAGTVVAAGTVAGLGVPPAAGRLIDRVGPLRVVVAAEVVQALGALAYLAARGTAGVVAAAVLLAAGQQLFYSSLFSLIADVAGDGPKDRPFAVAGMVRAACFSAGGLAAGGLLTLAGPAAYRIGVIADAVSFAVCALLLALLVRVPRPARRDAGGGVRAGAARRGPLSDPPFLAVIAATGLAALSVDFFLSGMSVYVLGELHGRPWLPGATLALSAGLSGAGGTAALRVTRRLRRTTTMALGAGLYVAWCGACLAALAVPPGWRPADLLAATAVMALACLAFQRANALAEAVAPTAARGRYLAAFQYAFTVPGVIAPAVVALYSVTVWLPWLLVAASAAAAAVLVRWLSGRLPAAALRAEEAPAPRSDHAEAEQQAVGGHRG
jgi:MFS family permease